MREVPAGPETPAPAQYYDSFWKTLRNAADHPTNIYRYELVAEILRGIGGEIGCIADLGCGNSIIVDYLRQHVSIERYVGLDVSAEIVAACNGLGRPGCEFHQVDLHLPLAEHFRGIADIVIACEVIEHLNDYRPFIENATLALRAGGTLVLTTPSGKLGRLERELFGHVRHFDRDALAAEIEGFGFEVVRKNNCGFPMLNLERRVASLFLDRILRSLENDFEKSRLFKIMSLVIGLGMKLSSNRFGCQLVIVARKSRSPIDRIETRAADAL